MLLCGKARSGRNANAWRSAASASASRPWRIKARPRLLCASGLLVSHAIGLSSGLFRLPGMSGQRKHPGQVDPGIGEVGRKAAPPRDSRRRFRRSGQRRGGCCQDCCAPRPARVPASARCVRRFRRRRAGPLCAGLRRDWHVVRPALVRTRLRREDGCRPRLSVVVIGQIDRARDGHRQLFRRVAAMRRWASSAAAS